MFQIQYAIPIFINNMKQKVYTEKKLQQSNNETINT